MNPTDHVDLSHAFLPKLHILPTFTTQHIAYSHGVFRDNSSIRVQVAFPSNTRGFFYYYCPVDAPATSGEIRFKIENTSRDLLLPNHLPWCIPLLSIATQINYRGFRTLLLQNKLVTPQLLTKCRTLVSSSTLPLMKDKRPVTIIHSLHQPFIVDFDSSTLSFWLLGDNSIRRGHIDLRFGATNVPYTGVSSNPLIRCWRGYHLFNPSLNSFSLARRLRYMSVWEVSDAGTCKIPCHCNAFHQLRVYYT